MLGLSLQTYRGVCEEEGGQARREQCEQKCGGLKPHRPWGRLASSSNPMVILDHEVGSGEGLPTLWLSHGHCVQLGMKKYIDFVLVLCDL